MSTSYGFACVTCDQNNYAFGSYDLVLETFIVQRAISAIQSDNRITWVSVDFLGGWRIWDYVEDDENYGEYPWDFLANHRGHDIWLLDEYGRRSPLLAKEKKL